MDEYISEDDFLKVAKDSVDTIMFKEISHHLWSCDICKKILLMTNDLVRYHSESLKKLA